MNRILPALLLLSATATAFAANVETQTLGVREGVMEQMSPSKLHERYKGFAEFITRTMGKPTLVDASQEAKFVLDNMKSGKYAVMFVVFSRPAWCNACNAAKIITSPPFMSFTPCPVAVVSLSFL